MSAFKEIPLHSRDLPQFEDHSRQQTKYTTCYMCACRCGIKVTLEDNKVRFIQGNPRHPVNKGVLCAKGAAGAMKQNSPAKLRNPLRRKPGSERGNSEFEEISWDEALDLLSRRLKKIRATDPKKLAFFTGRDQLQSFTGFWAMQFGTINWAAHGGFCSVNMAAGGLYTVGHSFWEFSDADFDRSKYFMLWGVAEDHASNPLKIGIQKIKRRGGKFVSINPVRTGYSAIADEWVPIKPGTDGMLALSMVHVLLKHDLVDHEYLIKYTNAPHLIKQLDGKPGDGLTLYKNEQTPEGWRFGRPMVWNTDSNTLADGTQAGVKPLLVGEFESPDGTPLKTVMTLMLEKYLDDEYSPENAAGVCGIPAERIERLALELAHIAFDESIEIECQWTDWAGRKHDKYVGRPVSMHAMRGISAHSNGFQTCRAIHLLQVLLGTIDSPGGHRAKPPYPKRIPPSNKPAREMSPNTPLKGNPLGFPTCPEHLLIDDAGKPLRLDKAFSWEAPLANHGMLHTVIANAVRGDPYPIDTLMLFMANLSWNSSMNANTVLEQLREKDDGGEYKLPFLVVVDAFDSEIVSCADLVLPDTTYLERHDCLSLLDRPPTEADAIVDSIRAPVLETDRNVRPWQDVMIDLATRLEFPEFITDNGQPRYENYQDFVVNFEKADGIGTLAGWRGEDGSKDLKGAPNPDQWDRYIENGCFYKHELPMSAQFFKFANKEYLDLAKDLSFISDTDEPFIMQLYSEPVQRFRLAGQGLYDGPMPDDPVDQHRLATYFDPLPAWYPPLEQTHTDDYPFFAVTQRPMMQYHSWHSQNAWLRQILSSNHLYLNRARATEMGLKDGDWVWLESHNGKVRAPIKLIEGTQPDTVWTWNAIGKRQGTWGLKPNAPESQTGFLLNHLISDTLPHARNARVLSNSDPITGQAAWYDLKIKITRADKADTTWPVPEPVSALPGETEAPDVLRYHTHKARNLRRPILQTLFKKLR